MIADLPPAQLAQRPETAYCIVSASKRFNVPAEGLLGIMLVEGGKLGQQVRNTNGSYDLGPMQVNTVWLTQKSPLYGYLDAARVRDHLCTNIHAAAWILASHAGRASGIWNAIGRYHSPGNGEYQWNYMQKVNGKLEQARAIMQGVPAYGQYMRTFFALPDTGK